LRFYKAKIVYVKKYFYVFNKLTDLNEEIKKLQCQMEEMYVSAEEEAEENN